VPYFGFLCGTSVFSVSLLPMVSKSWIRQTTRLAERKVGAANKIAFNGGIGR